MERLLIENARVSGGIVQIHNAGEWKPVPDSHLLSAGQADSEGFMIIGQDTAIYLVNTQPDSKMLIDRLIEALDLVAGLGNSVATTGAPLNPAIAAQAQGLIDALEVEELI